MLLNNRFPATREYPTATRSPSGNILNGEENISGWQVTLIDTCVYGREGLRAALYQYFPSPGHIDVTVVATPELPRIDTMTDEKTGATRPRCLVLRLPFSAREALHLLLQLDTLPAGYYDRVVILSAVAPEKVRRVLISTGLTGQICLPDDHLALSALCQVIAPVRRDCAGNIGCHSEVLLAQPHRQFTPAERRVLSQTLQGVSAREQARQEGTRIKTIYTQQAGGLHKLKVRDIRTLLRQFWPMRNRMCGENPE